MNKIFKSLLSVAVISASFASCSQVDTLSGDELAEQKLSTTVSLNKHSDWPAVNPVVFATNTSGTYNKVFYYTDKAMNVPVGQYKFYAINKYNAYEYGNLDFDKLPSESVYYGDVFVACKTEELNVSDEGVKKALPGKYVQLVGGDVYADSTKLINVELGQNVNVTFEKPYTLTKEYIVSGSFLSSNNVERIYVEICDVVARKKPNGSVAGSKKEKCVFSYGVSKNSKRDLNKTLKLLGIANSGTANIYIRCKDDDRSMAPELKSVRYTVVDGQDDNGQSHRYIKLGDITF